MRKIIVVASICILIIFVTIFLSIQHNNNLNKITEQSLSNSNKSESSTEIVYHDIVLDPEQNKNHTEEKEISSNDVDINSNFYFKVESLMSKKQFFNDVKDELSNMGRPYLDESILEKMYKVYVRLEGKMILDDYPILYRYLELDDYSIDEAALILKKDQKANGIFFK
ncbi:MAG: hypothetical protein PHE28_04685 [Bacteroidales bacterium]|nr:hypothetical protein [Bacteroidales bacterium]